MVAAAPRPELTAVEAANDALSTAEFARLYEQALKVARTAYGERLAPTGERIIDHAQALSTILQGLQTDANTQIAALLYGTTDAERADHPVSEEALEKQFGADVTSMVKGIVQLMRVTEIARVRDHLPADRKAAEKAVVQQSEALRKMLLAMVGDLRVVFVRLASRLRTLRWYAQFKDEVDTELRARYAQETLDVYAPLANRLGIWQLKWELEDLAFRFLEPTTYKRIAKMLEEKRVEREGYIARAIERLRSELALAGISAEVSGRPKHIYSIWLKMRGKGVDFGGLYDVRAFRVIVEDVKQCYTVLGLVHHLWQPIPREFDDYISRPKGNGYQSLHTVVVGDDGRPFEVQIRTRAMHHAAEYGVAAHWRYKEAGNKSLAATGTYEDKIAWIRQLFAWRSDVARHAITEGAPSDPTDTRRFDAHEWAERLKFASLDDRIYVLTPQARVIDLPAGSTPIDFAYHLHSDVGHRCRGAKVDGAIVPLDTPLKTGQTVEIITSKAPTAGPSRDWLNPALNYLASPRARTKVRAYFNAQELSDATTHGRARVEKELQRLGRTSVAFDDIASRLGYPKAEDLFVAAAREDFNVRHIDALFEAPPSADSEALPPARIGKERADASKSGVLVVGMDKLLTQLARCCKPAPPDRIRGFVTRGKGVSIHRADCKSFLRLAAADPQRVIDTNWGEASDEAVFPVDVAVQAIDRHGLLRDVSDVFAREKINVTGVKTQSSKGEAHMLFTAEVRDAAALARALGLIRDVAGVFDVARR
ncbi:MAG TPA: bifunctional (p)ppGpp synthetase/guanosine-3',5'-bis(diphosphate) 3'-pyrophosphohydrolase [Burkholderiaceae bacterium]|nr:bifunctional (p)ppGpp synthetase/guanosine-3',5'-bis(diphosphate) 3'-pyrophosphohydrolase [Burkholderiaceae bacterium]